ncbi:MAG: glycoside hydrolase family 25 protein [Candidatus Caenarcaniphilales bacterium]|nr:glycoside hydrolase family 25 protein [Candidatus Caenarcaniphilales bacterium]
MNHLTFKNIGLICFALLISFTSFACSKPEKKVEEIENPAQVLLTGIDVSNYNGQIDWQKVKESGVAFAFVKATEGITYKDPMLDANSKGLQEAGLVYGFYHFFRPEDDAIKQAKHYLESIPETEESKFLPLVVDIEVNDKVPTATLMNRLEKFVKYIEKHEERKPVIYSYSSFWNENFKAKFQDYPIWIADYNPYLENPILPQEITKWNFWQFTQKGKVPGVNGAVDRSFFQGDYEDLVSMLD